MIPGLDSTFFRLRVRPQPHANIPWSEPRASPASELVSVFVSVPGVCACVCGCVCDLCVHVIS